jgi:hypothetical protein
MDQLQPRFNPSKKVTLVGQTDVGGNLFITSYKKEPAVDLPSSKIAYESAATELKDKDEFPPTNPFDEHLLAQAAEAEANTPPINPFDEPLSAPSEAPAPAPAEAPAEAPAPTEATPDQIILEKREAATKRAADRIAAAANTPLPPPPGKTGGKSRRYKKTGKNQKGGKLRRKSRKQRK